MQPYVARKRVIEKKSLFVVEKKTQSFLLFSLYIFYDEKKENKKSNQKSIFFFSSHRHEFLLVNFEKRIIGENCEPKISIEVKQFRKEKKKVKEKVHHSQVINEKNILINLKWCIF